MILFVECYIYQRPPRTACKQIFGTHICACNSAYVHVCEDVEGGTLLEGKLSPSPHMFLVRVTQRAKATLFGDARLTDGAR